MKSVLVHIHDYNVHIPKIHSKVISFSMNNHNYAPNRFK